MSVALRQFSSGRSKAFGNCVWATGGRETVEERKAIFQQFLSEAVYSLQS